MSQETLDLRRSLRIVRRHKLLMGIMVAWASSPAAPTPSSNRSWSRAPRWSCWPSTRQAAQAGAAAGGNGGVNPWTATQLVIAESNPVSRSAASCPSSHVDRSASPRS